LPPPDFRFPALGQADALSDRADHLGVGFVSAATCAWRRTSRHLDGRTQESLGRPAGTLPAIASPDGGRRRHRRSHGRRHRGVRDHSSEDRPERATRQRDDAVAEESAGGPGGCPRRRARSPRARSSDGAAEAPGVVRCSRNRGGKRLRQGLSGRIRCLANKRGKAKARGQTSARPKWAAWWAGPAERAIPHPGEHPGEDPGAARSPGTEASPPEDPGERPRREFPSAGRPKEFSMRHRGVAPVPTRRAAPEARTRAVRPADPW
jgi:hypothetical protein